MKVKALAVFLGAAVVFTAAFADELHNKAMAATDHLQQAINTMHWIQQEHGDQFGGHMARAEELAQQAEQERVATIEYYRARHPGWQ
ncbi:hypothetical protein [Burkholderia diffusa]|uniref:hypothetical protein n=1 Tax=Burkholderia diffusa TaxID=488732 RepID=UPI0012D87042|nr:hypothetical protein [Burkholderia diffusa]